MDPAALSFGFFLGAATVAVPCWRAVVGARDDSYYRSLHLTDALRLVDEKHRWRDAWRQHRRNILEPKELP